LPHSEPGIAAEDEVGEVFEPPAIAPLPRIGALTAAMDADGLDFPGDGIGDEEDIAPGGREGI